MDPAFVMVSECFIAFYISEFVAATNTRPSWPDGGNASDMVKNTNIIIISSSNNNEYCKPIVFGAVGDSAE